MADLNQALGKIDAATTKLGGYVSTFSAAIDGISIRVDALREKIRTGMTAEQVAEVNGVLDAQTTKMDQASLGLDGVAAALNGIASDPGEPVPELPPPPPPVEEPPTEQPPTEDPQGRRR